MELRDVIVGRPSRLLIDETNVACSDVARAAAELAKELVRLEETLWDKQATNSVRAADHLVKTSEMLRHRIKEIRYYIKHGKHRDRDVATRGRRPVERHPESED